MNLLFSVYSLKGAEDYHNYLFELLKWNTKFIYSYINILKFIFIKRHKLLSIKFRHTLPYSNSMSSSLKSSISNIHRYEESAETIWHLQFYIYMIISLTEGTFYTLYIYQDVTFNKDRRKLFYDGLFKANIWKYKFFNRKFPHKTMIIKIKWIRVN